jgi:hypothetical protein
MLCELGRSLWYDELGMSNFVFRAWSYGWDITTGIPRHSYHSIEPCKKNAGTDRLYPWLKKLDKLSYILKWERWSAIPSSRKQ